MRGAQLAGLVILCLLGGCAYRVRLTSTPSPAQVVLPERGPVAVEESVATPTDVTFRWSPFNSQVVAVSAPGHRVLTVDLRAHEIKFTRYIGDLLFHPGAMFGGDPQGHVSFVLVPVHGPVGTWDPDEVD